MQHINRLFTNGSISVRLCTVYSWTIKTTEFGWLPLSELTKEVVESVALRIKHCSCFPRELGEHLHQLLEEGNFTNKTSAEPAP